MNKFSTSFCFLAIVGLVYATPTPKEMKSPCADIIKYHYDEAVKGRYGVEVALRSDYTLHGLWLRFIFDAPIKELSLNDKTFGEVKQFEEDKKSVLIKNREHKLAKGESQTLKFTVVYGDVEHVPALLMYRMNGRQLCPAED